MPDITITVLKRGMSDLLMLLKQMVLGLNKNNWEKNSKYWNLKIEVILMGKEICYYTNSGCSPWSDTLRTSSISGNTLNLSDLNALIYKKPPCLAVPKFLNAT